MGKNDIYYLKKIGLDCCSICGKWKKPEDMTNYNSICKDCFKQNKKEIKRGMM